jgi:hypothetical protein
MIRLFILYLTQKKIRKSLKRQTREIQALESAYNQKLGSALFEVYGTAIPPDATMTLRLADGVVEGFPLQRYGCTSYYYFLRIIRQVLFFQ